MPVPRSFLRVSIYAGLEDRRASPDHRLLVSREQGGSIAIQNVIEAIFVDLSKVFVRSKFVFGLHRDRFRIQVIKFDWLRTATLTSFTQEIRHNDR